MLQFVCSAFKSQIAPFLPESEPPVWPLSLSPIQSNAIWGEGVMQILRGGGITWNLHFIPNIQEIGVKI